MNESGFKFGFDDFAQKQNVNDLSAIANVNEDNQDKLGDQTDIFMFAMQSRSQSRAESVRASVPKSTQEMNDVNLPNLNSRMQKQSTKKNLWEMSDDEEAEDQNKFISQAFLSTVEDQRKSVQRVDDSKQRE